MVHASRRGRFCLEGCETLRGMEVLLGLAVITLVVVLALVWALRAGCPHCGGDISNGNRFVFPICSTCARDRRLRAADYDAL